MLISPRNFFWRIYLRTCFRVLDEIKSRVVICTVWNVQQNSFRLSAMSLFLCPLCFKSSSNCCKYHSIWAISSDRSLLELLWRWNKQPNWIMLQQMMTLLPNAFNSTPIINTIMTRWRGREAREYTHSMSSAAKDSFILKTSCNNYHIFRNLTIDAKKFNINLVIYVEVGGWMLCLMIKHRKESLQLAE